MSVVKNNLEYVSDSKPNVMCFSGLDPTGGAGIQADIETVFSIGCHCLPIITANTVQNTHNALSIEAVDAAFIVQQARAVLEDIPVHCFKIGLIGSVACIQVLHTLLRDYPQIPVVLDPIISAGGGFSFSSPEVVLAMRNLLLPLTTVLTPNVDEIKKLAPTADNVDACANEILETGCRHVLLTGTHAQSSEVINKLYTHHQQVILYSWPRLANNYHGSGCTLAASIAARLAQQLGVRDAVRQAQRFTWESLSHGVRIGFGQHIPNRSAWTESE
jgi:hydroxymethylpyrimidine/phosphomethylpyrimidine kinase